MKTSQSITRVATALSKVQSELAPLARAGVNPDVRGKYLTMADVWEAARPLLGREGLAVTFSVDQPNADLLTVETVLLHGESGEFISTAVTLPVLGRWAKGGGTRLEPDAQAVGSAITYGRRYGLSAILGIVAEEDDDGRRASARGDGDRSQQQQQGTTRQQQSGGSTAASEKQLAYLQKLMARHFFTDEDRKLVAEQVEKGLTRERASTAIEWAKSVIADGETEEAAAKAAALAGDDGDDGDG